MKKRFLSVLLMLCVALTMLPTAVLAADGTGTLINVAVVDGTDGVTPVTNPVAGQKLTANIETSEGIIGSYPVNSKATYKWYYEGSDAVLGTQPVFTVTRDHADKVLCVDVNVEGYEGGPKTWKASGKVEGTVTGVTVVDGTDGYTPVGVPFAGQKLTANIETNVSVIGSYPRNPNATYKWYYKENSGSVLGTDPVYTVTADNLGKTICVEVGVSGYNGIKTWEATGAVSRNILGVSVVDGTDGYTPVAAPVAGQKLTANIETTDGTIGSYPVDSRASYKWHYKDNDAVLGSEAVFTVTRDHADKVLCVEVNVTGYNGGPMTWEAAEKVEGTVVGVSVVDGTDGYTPVTSPVTGQKLTANIQTNVSVIGSYPVNPNATYRWYYKENNDATLGREAVYTVTSDNLGKILCVDVGVNEYTGAATWEATGAVAPGYVITFDAKGGTGAPASALTNAEGKLSSLPVPVRSDYTFKGWFTAATGGTQITVDTVFDADVTVYAQWSYSGSDGWWDGGSSGATTYAIAIADTANGTVKLSTASASKGTAVTVTVTPNTGYKLDKLTAEDGDGKALTLTDKGEGKYTFTMPASKVTVTAAFISESEWSNPFADVSTGDWYYDAVAYVNQHNIMNGTAAPTFAPGSNLTRGMIAQVLYNLEQKPQGGTSVFTDVAADAWYADAVNWAAGKNIVGGYGEGKFGPEDSVTREQMAAILYRYAQYKGYDTKATADLAAYTDVQSVSDWALAAMQWANASGLINGRTETTLVPGGTATRAEVASILMRFCENIAK